MANYVFKRYELKYMLTEPQYRAVIAEVSKQLRPDAYGETTIQSLYYDTADDRIIRASIEQPVYKEKLRLRCYGLCEKGKDVFLEMKRKYDGIVYKRRIALPEDEVDRVLSGDCPDTQIGREIRYFLSFYPALLPKMMILYDRSAWLDPGSDLRVTFDRNVRFRTNGLNCHTSLDGTPLLPEGTIIMECKSAVAFPLWLTRLFCKEGIRKSAFSKYGAAYALTHSAVSVTQKSNCQGELIYV